MFFFIAKDCYFPKLSLKTRVLTYIFPLSIQSTSNTLFKNGLPSDVEGYVSGIAQSFRSPVVLNRGIDIRDIYGMGWSQLASAN